MKSALITPFWSVASRRLCAFAPAKRRMMSSKDGSLMDAVDKVRTQLPGSSWDDLWKDGMTPWDLGKPTPLLIDELRRTDYAQEAEVLRYRSLVPGCGGGYDLLTLQEHHSKLPLKAGGESVVVGLDLSATALARAKDTVVAGASSDSSNAIELRCGDFFEDPTEWNEVFSSNNISSTRKAVTQFDFIFDYTFFCALPPHLRTQWGAQMAKLLDPTTGRLLTFMFPILPDADAMQGPPFPVSIQDYIAVLDPHGIVMEGQPFESPLTVPSRAGKEMVCFWTFNTATSRRSAI